MQNQYDKILYGKNELQRIVSIEVNGSVAEVFIQKEDGTLDVEVVPNKYWCLSPKPINRHAKRLEGDLHYKWGYQFTELDDYLAFRKINYKHDLYCLGNHKEALQVKDGYTYYKGMNPKEVNILSFDIETTGIVHDESSKVLLISNTFRNHKGEVTKRLFAYDDYKTTGEFLTAWCDWVREVDPSIVCGHNITSYDFPYLSYIAEMNGITLDLGRDDSPLRFNEIESKFRVDGTRDLHYKKCFIYGRELLDTMFLAVKSDISKKYVSYGLKQIIKQEGLEKEDRQFYDASQIRFKYKDKEEWEKIKQYAKDDADDSLALFDLMIPPFFYLGQMIPKPFQLVMETASGSQINSLLCRAYLQDKHSLPKASDTNPFEGAISWARPGIHKNVLSFDVQSLYPSLILQYEISDKLKDPKNYMLYLCKTLRTLRLKNKELYKSTKEEKYEHIQITFKTIINSIYGFLGAQGLNFNSPKCAEEVTRRGRDTLLFAIEWATGKPREEFLKEYKPQEDEETNE